MHREKPIKKAFLCVWWKSKRIVHHEFIKPSETVNADVYSSHLDRLNNAVLQKQPSRVQGE